MTIERAQDQAAAGMPLELRHVVEREHLEHVAMRAVTRWRIGREPRRLEIRVSPEQRCTVVLAQRALGELLGRRSDTRRDRVDERRRRGAIAVLDEQDQRARGFGDRAPAQRRRDALAIGGAPYRERTTVRERRALQHEGHGNGRDVRALRHDPIETGADAREGLTDEARQFLQHMIH
jgi:hypothetical protein